MAVNGFWPISVFDLFTRALQRRKRAIAPKVLTKKMTSAHVIILTYDDKILIVDLFDHCYFLFITPFIFRNFPKWPESFENMHFPLELVLSIKSIDIYFLFHK